MRRSRKTKPAYTLQQRDGNATFALYRKRVISEIFRHRVLVGYGPAPMIKKRSFAFTSEPSVIVFPIRSYG